MGRAVKHRRSEALTCAGADLVILLGSMAHGTASPSSEIDLAVVVPAARGQPVPGRGADILACVPHVAVTGAAIFAVNGSVDEQRRSRCACNHPETPGHTPRCRCAR
jgi:hypothetical protein